MSTQSKRAAVGAVVFTILSMALNIIPMAVYIVRGYIVAGSAEKVTLTVTIVAAVIFMIINIVSKMNLRSVFWILLIGISICVDEIEPLLITMATTVIIDEFLVEPFAKHFRNKLRINRELDKRL